MSGNSEILQEYLVRLGFQSDAISLRKFEDGLSVTGKKVLGVGTAVAGVVASVEAASAAFAYSMRKIYFESELSNSSVKNLNAMKYAGEQIGVTGDAMANAIHSMAQAMRLNPGLQGLVESFGIKVTGRDMSDVMVDYVNALKSMPEFVGAQYAGIFGIDPDTYHQMINHMDELKQKKQDLLNQYKTAGIDPDKAKQTMLDYASTLDSIESKISMLATGIEIKFAPQFKAFSSVIENSLDWWIKWAAGINSVGAALDGISSKNVVGFLSHVFGFKDNTGGTGKEGIDKLLGRTSSGSVSGKIIKHTLPAAPATTQSVGHRNERNNNPGNLRYGNFARRHGAIGQDKDGFAIFPDISAGFRASQNLLATYGGQGINTVGGIVSKWAPSSENDTAAYSSYLAKKMGVGLNQPLDMSNPETLSALSRNIAAYEGMSSARLGNEKTTGNVLKQTTNIKVTGTNAQETAKAVVAQQTRVNADLSRNMRGMHS